MIKNRSVLCGFICSYFLFYVQVTSGNSKDLNTSDNDRDVVPCVSWIYRNDMESSYTFFVWWMLHTEVCMFTVWIRMSILVYIWSKGWKPLTSLDASFHAICKTWEQKWSWGDMGLVPKQQGRSNPLWVHDMPKGSTVNWYVYPFIYPAYLPRT